MKENHWSCPHFSWEWYSTGQAGIGEMSLPRDTPIHESICCNHCSRFLTTNVTTFKTSQRQISINLNSGIQPKNSYFKPTNLFFILTTSTVSHRRNRHSWVSISVRIGAIINRSCTFYVVEIMENQLFAHKDSIKIK